MVKEGSLLDCWDVGDQAKITAYNGYITNILFDLLESENYN